MAFYNSDAFNNSPAGQLLIRATGSGIDLEVTQVVAVAAFLRAINALENIRQCLELLDQSTWKEAPKAMRRDLLTQAVHEADDAVMVLVGAGLHPDAVIHLRAARDLTKQALRKHFQRGNLIQQAISEHRMARSLMIETP